MPIPFPVVNFGSALAGISRSLFLVGSALGMLPATFIYSYFAATLFAAARGESEGAVRYVLVAFGAVILLGLGSTLWLALKRRRRYRQLVSRGRGRAPPDDG